MAHSWTEPAEPEPEPDLDPCLAAGIVGPSDPLTVNLANVVLVAASFLQVLDSVLPWQQREAFI